MQTLAPVLACLACAGHGGKTQRIGGRMQCGPFKELSSTLRAYGFVPSSHSEVCASLRAFTILLLAAKPASAWQQAFAERVCTGQKWSQVRCCRVFVGEHRKSLQSRHIEQPGMGKEAGESKAALLLLDLQKAFTVGRWAQYFGGGRQVQDIQRACEETANLLSSGQVSRKTPIICTKCYLDGPEDEGYVDVVEPLLREAYCIHKPTMDVTGNPAFFPWLQEQVEIGVNVLVIGGCTTTSCVRVSSQQIVAQLKQYQLADKVRVVVDLNLCGARMDNLEKTADEDHVLVNTYGLDICKGKSAVDLAILQMRQNGVEVLDADSGGWKDLN